MPKVICWKCKFSYFIPESLQKKILDTPETEENNLVIQEELIKYHNCNYSEEA